MQQQTLANSFQLEGKGLHTGLDIKISFLPAPENHGYKIKRVDLDDEPIIDAIAENVNNTNRGTVITKKEISISTIEHAMSALYAMGIDNCLIEVNAPEFPILDGSAKPYVDAINKVGIESQEADRQYYIVKKRIEVVDEETGSKIILLPDNDFALDVHIAFPSAVLSNQSAQLETLADYEKEIAAARTFVFVREIKALLDAILIKGGDLDNALVIYDEPMEQSQLDSLCDTLGVEHKTVSQLGYINNGGLNFPNEPARHKLLDLIGDLALIGKYIKGHIIATCPGHGINNKMARMIRKEIKLNESQAPVYDMNEAPLMDINRIKELLPHRFPFLLVDKIIDLGNDYIVGVKNVSGNEPFFPGHFPNEPVMPGVLQVEAMAQVGGLLVLHTLPDSSSYSTYFLMIDKVKFRRKVVPGDTLVFKLRLISEVRRGVAVMRGLAFVGEQLVCEAEFTAQIIKNEESDN